MFGKGNGDDLTFVNLSGGKFIVNGERFTTMDGTYDGGKFFIKEAIEFTDKGTGAKKIIDARPVLRTFWENGEVRAALDVDLDSGAFSSLVNALSGGSEIKGCLFRLTAYSKGDSNRISVRIADPDSGELSFAPLSFPFDEALNETPGVPKGRQMANGKWDFSEANQFWFDLMKGKVPTITISTPNGGAYN